MNRSEFFKDLVWEPLVKAALGRLFAAVPILGFGPIGWVVTAVVTLFTNQLYDAIAMAVSLELIGLKNQEHQRAFIAASLDLQRVALEQGLESIDFQKARDEHKAALTRFVRFAPK